MNARILAVVAVIAAGAAAVALAGYSYRAPEQPPIEPTRYITQWRVPGKPEVWTIITPWPVEGIEGRAGAWTRVKAGNR